MAEPAAAPVSRFYGARVELATIGAHVPPAQAVRFAAAIAAEAMRFGYLAVVAENGTIAGIPPGRFPDEPAPTRSLGPAECPSCLRKVRRYSGGKFYDHHCEPATVEGRSWTITLPYRDVWISENSRMHHMERHKLVKQLRKDGWALGKSHKLPRCERVRVTLHWRPKARRTRDGENPTPTLKALCDGLTDAGLVTDDTHDRMEKRVEIHEPERGHPARLWLTIDELEVADA